jgi:phage gp36-like protein
MKNFIHKPDLYRSIKESELEVLLNQTPDGDNLVKETIDSSVSEIKTYIGGRYDVTLGLPLVYVYDPAQEYSDGDIVFITGPDWTAADYVASVLVKKGKTVYFSTEPTLSTDIPGASSKWSELGENMAFFESLVDTNDALPTETANSSPSTDPRDPLVKTYAVDIALYRLFARINPRQIQESRIKHYDDAVTFLTKAADPRKNINLALPLIDFGANSGNDITFGSNTKNSHSW